MTGSEWKRFYENPAIWPVGAYWEDALITVDGDADESIDLGEVSDTAVICVEGGDIIGGAKSAPSDLEGAIDWWRMRQTNSYFHISIPNDKIEAAVAMLALRGITAKQVI